ncbi:Serine-rich 25 kDa antigen protein [Holothuria leucospilota]|uniref:Serine-rich 25 kDa antigen protein n=1 Tax=Holothuria leucospilota TaxID=206669 RepID=A0A9Q1C7H1_HOLLE|nr:Serine-rich 25 kDa antigen protein [Holothuria leucospilota]
MKSVVLVLSVLLGISTAHVRLTFPPARQYDFDFLDNVRTNGPCGMQSDNNTVVTELEKGSTFNVTWHLAYSHRGGFRLRLIRGNEILANLTGNATFINDDDITSTSYAVTLPPEFVGRATLQLTRHAREWTTGSGAPYVFWSCGEVNVVETSTCNRGCPASCNNGKCTSCHHLATGDFCQYEDDCLGPADCSNRGECWRVSTSTYPRNQCFCEQGYFGRKCERENPSDFSVDIDKSKYFTRSMSPDYRIYYMIREDQSEIEIAIEANSTTWVALGWRPNGLPGTCQNFPVQYRTGEPVSEPESEPESAPETTSEPSSTGRRRRRQALPQGGVQIETEDYDSNWTCNANSWSSPGGSPQAEPEAEPEGSAEPEAEPEASAEPESEPEATAEPESEPEATAEPESEPEATAEPESEPEATAEPESEPEATGEPESEPEATGEPESEPEATGEPEGEPETGAGGGRNLHPMDCVDIIIGKAKGLFGNVGDFYTRDRSTPRRDDFYGGQDDLVAAAAKEENGKTTVVFRRKLETSDMADHAIANQQGMDVIWARGQERGREVHRPRSGLERCEAKNIEDYLFYQKDDVKYHGTSGMQRGIIRGLDFYADPNPSGGGSQCGGQLAQPSGCSGSACTYTVEWQYNSDEDEVEFTIRATMDHTQWTGIGFSQEGSMVNSDAVLAWYDEATSTGSVKDYFLGARSTSGVVEDDSQDITDTSVTYENGILQFSFKRKRNTEDAEQDMLFGDNNCVFILQPLEGGQHNGGSVQYHQSTPIASSSRVCFRACNGGLDENGGQDTVTPTVGVGDCTVYSDESCDATGLIPSIVMLMVVYFLQRVMQD